MINLFKIAQLLGRANVDFAVVGGVAIRRHGGSYPEAVKEPIALAGRSRVGYCKRD